MQLTMSSGWRPLRSITSRTSSSVPSRMASASFCSTVVAPLGALSFTGGNPRRWPIDPRRRRARRQERAAGSIAAGAGRAAAGVGRRPTKPLDLGGRQPAALARRESVESERAERDPFEGDDAVPDRFEHPADLAVAAFADRDLDARGAGRGGEAGRGAGAGARA